VSANGRVRGRVPPTGRGVPDDRARPGTKVNVAPGERYSVLVHLDQPGTWVWHCHILNHVERDTRMYGMVTAVVVS
jgi:FtsP/CotA-like multicopper oxidase with cupredoxin domain